MYFLSRYLELSLVVVFVMLCVHVRARATLSCTIYSVWWVTSDVYLGVTSWYMFEVTL